MTSGAFGIPDEEFWRDPGAHRDAATSRALAQGWRGYALDAPRIVDLRVRDTLPVALLRCVSAAESAAHDLARNAILVAVRRATSEVFVGRAFNPKYTPRSRVARASPSPTITLADTFFFELRERLSGLPWTPGSYALYLLVREVATAAVVVRLVVPSGPRLHPAPVFDAPWPPPGERRLPRYTRAERSPAVPQSEGVSLVCDPVVLLQRDGWCVLEGSFNLRADLRDDEGFALGSLDDEETKRRHAVVVEEETQRTTAVDLEAMAKESAVLAPLTLVLTSDALDEPWSCTLSLPATLSAGAVTGYFALDLFTLPDFPRRPGSYFLWAFAGDTIAGPEPVALILEERLSPP